MEPPSSGQGSRPPRKKLRFVNKWLTNTSFWPRLTEKLDNLPNGIKILNMIFPFLFLWQKKCTEHLHFEKLVSSLLNANLQDWVLPLWWNMMVTMTVVRVKRVANLNNNQCSRSGWALKGLLASKFITQRKNRANLKFKKNHYSKKTLRQLKKKHRKDWEISQLYPRSGRSEVK